MDTLVQCLKTLDDVGRLFAHLGYRPAREPVGSGHTVAGWHGFNVVAQQAEDPLVSVRRLAVELGKRPGRHLAVVLGSTGELAIAAPRLGRPGTTAVLHLNVHNLSGSDRRHLERFRPEPDMTGLELALRVDGLLATEVVSARFYAAFRLQHHRMTDGLPPEMAETDRHLAALLPLLRILFLYFIQAKGWLDDDPEFLRRRLDAALDRNIPFQAEVLHPLFFDALNRPTAERRGSLRKVRVPYLNGGLFQRQPVEQEGGPCSDNDMWRDAFDTVFERFRFSVRQSEELNTVAPDMLGHVFERLMKPEERQSTGTFYTPETIVVDLVRTTIDMALARAVGIDAGQLSHPGHLPEADRTRAGRALQNLRVLDPAAGTGAFLLGALDRLTYLHQALHAHDHPSPALGFRKHALRNNLFGVDINPVAVRLAELRLWLAVIADDPTTDIAAVEPLPNLDGIVMQGDTLFDPIGSARALGIHPSLVPTTLVRQVETARKALYALRGPAYRHGLVTARRQERELARVLIARSHTRAVHRLKDLDTAAEDRDLFGKRIGLTPDRLRARIQLAQQRDALERWHRSDRAGAAPFFSFDVNLPDVMQQGGFHAVVGNPPWIRAERLPPETRRALKARFMFWNGSGAPSRGYRHQPDLSVAFLERALELTRPGGVTGLLVPNKIVTADYGEAARRHLVQETTVRYLHRVPETQANLFGATTYPLAMILEKRAPAPGDQVRLSFTGTESLTQRSLDTQGPWILMPDRNRAALGELQESGVPLGAFAPVALGIKTGANAIFVGRAESYDLDRCHVRVGGSTFTVPKPWYRPVLRGRDVHPFRAVPGRIILWPVDSAGDAAASLPPSLLAYLTEHRTTLQARADARGARWWSLFRTRSALAPHRVVWPDIARRPRAVSIEHTPTPEAVPINTCYVSTPPSAAAALLIAAMLNTTWTATLARAISDEARGGYRRLNARVMGTIPVPELNSGAAQDLASLSERIHHGETADQNTLDELAAEALGLTTRHRESLRIVARHPG